MKTCQKHGNVKFIRNGPDRWKCSKCAAEAVNRRRRKLKLMAIEYLGGKCNRCGYNKCAVALDFHHTVPGEKDFAIGSANKAWTKIQAELDKCELLCANCHREEHEGQKADME